MIKQEDKCPELLTQSVKNGFYQNVITFFHRTEKTGWGKNEIVDKIRDLYIEYLEQQ